MENVSQTPLDIIKAFLRGQPEGVAQDLCFLALGAMPGEQINQGDPVQRIIGWIDDKAGGSELEVAGAAVILRSLFDFVAMDQRGTKEGWIEIESAMQWGVDRAREENKSSPVVENALADIPRRRELWLASTRQWRDLCGSQLSNGAINVWWNRQFSLR